MVFERFFPFLSQGKAFVTIGQVAAGNGAFFPEPSAPTWVQSSQLSKTTNEEQYEWSITAQLFSDFLTLSKSKVEITKGFVGTHKH